MLEYRLSLVLAATLAGGCTTEVVTWEEPPSSDRPSRPEEEDDDDDGDDARSAPVGQEVTGIPTGHLPPPGGCRVWHPDRSPGQQPSSGDCDELRDRIPEDAWLLYRPTEEPRVYRIG